MVLHNQKFKRCFPVLSRDEKIEIHGKSTKA